MKKFTATVLSMLLLGSIGFSLYACAPSGGGGNIGDGSLSLDEDFVCTITVDGGGQWANYNSTASMEESVTNPYPYNTLETLAEEYMDLHPNVTIEIAKTSYNGSRDSILPMLSTSSAPDILFQVPTALAEDCNKNYYAKLDEYLQLPNPYSKEGEAGSEKWIDIYNGELQPAVDGHYYYTPMERSVVGIVYNKTYFENNNLEIPTTYSEFLALIEKIHGLDADLYPYSPNGGNMWLDITLEGTIFQSLMDEIDLDGSGTADAEEILRAYSNGTFDPEGEIYDEFLDLVAAKTKYSGNPNTYSCTETFLSQQTIMVEAGGSDIDFLISNADGFEAGVFAFPLLDSEATDLVEEGTGVRRGSSGLSTAWFITNHAFSSSDADENLKKVNACVDFLMFLTAAENNDRMINDKGVAVPLSGNGSGKHGYFESLTEQYELDCANENMFVWGNFNPSGTLTKAYYDAYFIAYHNYLYGNTTTSAKGDKNQFINAVMNGLDSALNKLSTLNGWDTSNW